MNRRKTRRLRGQSLNRLIPNILTLLALCAGVTAIRYALDEAWDRAVIAIVVAAVLDALDGRIARLLGTSSRFGAELDSLSDFVCFGVAPAILIYQWSLHEAGGLLGIKKAATVAETAAINICLHGVFETGITTCAANQAAATIPNLDDGNQIMPQLLVEDIVAAPDLTPVAGRLPVFGGPGLGFELDRDAVARAAERAGQGG